MLDFFAKMEGFDSDDPKDLRKAALQAVEVFGIDGGKQDAKSGDQPKAKAKPSKSAKRAPEGAKRVEKEEPAPGTDEPQDKPTEANGERANKPLTFELQLDASHQYLEDRGLAKALIKTFGLGVAKRGSMQGRLCFPIHNKDGELIAYSGRWVEDKLPKDTPRYKLPKGFENPSQKDSSSRKATDRPLRPSN